MIVLRSDFATAGIVFSPSLVDDKHEFVSADLHVGSIYFSPNEPMNPLPFEPNSRIDRNGKKVRGQGVCIQRQSCVLVQTHERIKLPGDKFGWLVAKATLSGRGLVVANTKVDPTFDDFLKVPVFNAGEEPIVLFEGDPFCAIVFAGLQGSVPGTAPTRHPPQFIPQRRSFWTKLRKFFAVPLVVAIIGGMFSAGLITGINLWFRFNYDSKQTSSTVPPPSPRPLSVP